MLKPRYNQASSRFRSWFKTTDFTSEQGGKLDL